MEHSQQDISQVPVISKERNNQYVLGKKVILRTALVATLRAYIEDCEGSPAPPQK